MSEEQKSPNQMAVDIVQALQFGKVMAHSLRSVVDGNREAQALIDVALPKIIADIEEGVAAMYVSLLSNEHLRATWDWYQSPAARRMQELVDVGMSRTRDIAEQAFNKHMGVQ